MIGLLITTGASVMYKNLNDKIEKMSELLYVIAFKLTVPSGMLPPFIIFTIDYFMGNVSDESFYTPVPVV